MIEVILILVVVWISGVLVGYSLAEIELGLDKIKEARKKKDETDAD